MSLHAFNVALSDITLFLQLGSLAMFALDTWLVARRDGPAIRRFAEFAAGMLVFFAFFTVVYLDRRFDVVPGVDLFRLVGFEWSWPLRLITIVTSARLWWTLRPSGPAPRRFDQMPDDEQRHHLAGLQYALDMKRAIYRRQHEEAQ